MSVKNTLLNYIKKNKMLVCVLIILIISLTILSIVPSQLLRIIIDDLIQNNKLESLPLFALYYMLTYVVISIINFIESYLLICISEGVSRDLRINLLKKVQKLTYLNFVKNDTGTIESHFSSDVDEINNLISSGAISMLIDLLKIVAILVSIFIYSYVLGLVILLVIPFIIFISIKIKNRMFNSQLENKKMESKVNNYVLESFDNITTIKSFRIYQNVKKEYKTILKSFYKSNQKSNNYDSLFSPLIMVIKYSLIVLVILLTKANFSFFTLTCGMLVSSIDLISNLFSPIESVGTEIQSIQRSRAALSRINNFFKLEEDDEKYIENVNLDKVSVEYQNVCFSYDNINNVLDNFSYEINPYDKLILKGPSGSGKSTIFKLCFGLLKPNSGNVYVNNTNVYYLKNEVKQKIFGIIYQDTFFSGGTIKEELTLLDQNISEQKIYEVLKLVGLDYISDINQRLEEDKFSTGELEMLNVCRVLLKNPEIILIDELSAKLDFLTSKKIFDLIQTKFNDKIILSINHFGYDLKNSKTLNLEKK